MNTVLKDLANMAKETAKKVAKPIKDKVGSISFRVDQELWDLITEVVNATGVDKTELITEALRIALPDLGRQKAEERKRASASFLKKLEANG